mmetsp:Transcript_955/g.2288  ORF Transcript_955/g.2288 Transcript_955/m.2288 type:complete len:80 (+) Transcript_955:391-630(+)
MLKLQKTSFSKYSNIWVMVCFLQQNFFPEAHRKVVSRSKKRVAKPDCNITFKQIPICTCDVDQRYAYAHKSTKYGKGNA